MTARTAGDGLLAASPYATIGGLVGLAVVSQMGFEEPHWGAFFLFAAISAAAPLALAVHLCSTTELTREEKRRWANGLLSWRVMALFPAYFSARERARAT